MIFNFFLTHWVLSILFLLVFICSIFFEVYLFFYGGISAEKAIDLINYDGALIFDFREKDIFAVGHIKGSFNLSYEDLYNVKFKKLCNKRIVFVCDWNKKFFIFKKFKSFGFNNVHYLSGGINSWNSKGLPLNKFV